MVQLAFTGRIFAGAKDMGLHTAIETSGFLGDRADESYLKSIDLVLLDIKKFRSRYVSPSLQAGIWRLRCASRNGSRRYRSPCGSVSRSSRVKPMIRRMSRASPGSLRR